MFGLATVKAEGMPLLYDPEGVLRKLRLGEIALIESAENPRGRKRWRQFIIQSYPPGYEADARANYLRCLELAPKGHVYRIAIYKRVAS